MAGASIDRAALAARLAAAPLFARLGAPIAEPNPRLGDWDSWPGSEHGGALSIAERQQALHDALVAEAAEHDWQAALALGVARAATAIPLDPAGDAWHAPTTAGWSAAWTFALEAACAAAGRPVPADLAAQLHWYARGHWPAALIDDRGGDDPGDYLVY